MKFTRRFTGLLKLLPFFVLPAYLIFSGGCVKEQFTTSSSAKLRFSVDTLTFDTVFTTLGSVTLSLKVFNDNKSKIKISSVNLAGGANSSFAINVDGVQGPNVQNVQIDGHDSIYIFVQVTVNPNNQNNPFVILDSLQFLTNGNHQDVILEAWGQNAHFYNGQAISGSSNTWINDKPYVILNSLLVSPGASLTINPGVTIYMGSNSGLYVAGNLTVNGDPDGKCDDSITFRGVRTESYYVGVPGQWSGIYILRGATCSIDHAVISDSYYGLNIGSSTTSNLLAIGPPPAGEMVNVTNTVIENTESTSIFCFWWNATFKNCLVYNAGGNMVTFATGGTYLMEQCTLANYGSAAVSPSAPIIQLSNFAASQTGDTTIGTTVKATFINTIIYGSLTEELSLSDTAKTGSTQSDSLNYLFQNCLIQTMADTVPGSFVSDTVNVSPDFNNPANNDYHLATGSPCIGFGVKIPGLTSDLGCTSYLSPPSIGCYQQ